MTGTKSSRESCSSFFYFKPNMMAAKLLRIGLLLLLAKVFIAILWQYRFYFPPNFESDFLSGRRYTFTIDYQIAFFTHLFVAPWCLLFAAIMSWTGRRSKPGKIHRLIGRLTISLILLLLVPSGLYMSLHAYGGPIAVSGFLGLTSVTALAAILTWYYAVNRHVQKHQEWANRLLLILISPLIARIFGGAMVVTQWESSLTYCINAWFSWVIPLLLWEAKHYAQSLRRSTKQAKQVQRVFSC